MSRLLDIRWMPIGTHPRDGRPFYVMYGGFEARKPVRVVWSSIANMFLDVAAGFERGFPADQFTLWATDIRPPLTEAELVKIAEIHRMMMGGAGKLTEPM